MASGRIAARYSKSLLDLAKASNVMDEVHSDMDTVLETLASSSELRNLLKNPIVKTSDKQAVFSKVFSGCHKISVDFINFLAERGREAELPLVAKQYVETHDKMKGIQRATITSATPLSQETIERVKSYIQGMIGSGQLEVTNEIDPSIIGGMIIRHEDKLLDMSVSRELREIRKELIYN